MRFGYITDQIAIGGAMNSLETFLQMQEYLGGITHIICLTRLCPYQAYEPDMRDRYKRYPSPEVLQIEPR